MSQQVLSITQINEYIRNMMDHDSMLSGLAVRGEISNYKVYPSGHHYFTLKDENAALRCVMFKSSAVRLRFRPENGMQVIVMGKISVYPRDGAYQLYASAMVVDGVGDLHTAFEQLKAKLAQKGYFDPAHKVPLPKYPGVIGIVTSSAGAAVHDMLQILRKRYPLTTVKLLPVRVQGIEAPAEIAGAIYYANQSQLADLLIVGRGGGSLEDLWAFNDELVAKAIYDSQIPVISAVGHEPDVTISDYVADLRAATPSNAAELAVPDQDALRQTLDSIQSALNSAAMQRISACRRHLNILAGSSAMTGPTQYIRSRKDNLNHLSTRLRAAQLQTISKNRHRFVSVTAKMDAMSPLKVLSRGYALAQTDSGEIIRSNNQVSVNDSIKLTISDGVLYAAITDKEETTIHE